MASICDADYSQSMTAIAAALGHLITPPCIEPKIQNDAKGNPDCSVIENLTDASGNQTHHGASRTATRTATPLPAGP